jgi:hypothetical protein
MDTKTRRHKVTREQETRKTRHLCRVFPVEYSLRFLLSTAVVPAGGETKAGVVHILFVALWFRVFVPTRENRLFP